MNHLTIVGMGPGHPDYILPKAFQAIRNADVIVAGKRHLSLLEELGELKDKEFLVIDKNLRELMNHIQSLSKKQVVICVSGDPGFFSLLNYLKKSLPEAEFETIAGLSSLSYLFAKVNMPYQDAYLSSLHGREVDLKELVKSKKLVGLLTDSNHDVAYIGKILKDLDVEIIVGENLSYPDEKILKLDAKRAANYQSRAITAVIIVNHEK